jgi:murein DD-endopeptidase MepM/ murein hydrolase activator NlpD
MNILRATLSLVLVMGSSLIFWQSLATQSAAAELTIDKPCNFSKSYGTMNTSAERNHDGNQWRPVNSAMDIQLNTDCSNDRAALAVRNGTVYYNTNIEGFGYHAKLVTDTGNIIYYAHLISNSNSVANGSAVVAGQQIAQIGCTGNCSGDHIHFEVRDSAGGYLNNSTWEFGSLGNLTSQVPPTTYQYRYTNPRVMVDFNGDGKADAIGFGNYGVHVATSTGAGFNSAPTPSLDQMGSVHGWNSTQHVRTAGDINGDKKADVVGFGNDSVWAAISTGTGFGPLAVQLGGGMSYNQGWRTDLHPRMVSDVNGDGMADLVGFYYDGVYVALYNGGSFNAPTRWLEEMGYNHGWRVEKHERVIADVNGDGSGDLIGFGEGAIYVALSNGINAFNIQAYPLAEMSYLQGWRVESHPRVVADVTGDGKADAVGFGWNSVYSAISTSTTFSSASSWLSAMTYYTPDWRVEKHPRMAADVTGDGKADAIGFGNSGILVGTSTGSAFNSPGLWLGEMGYDAGGWR